MDEGREKSEGKIEWVDPTLRHEYNQMLNSVQKIASNQKEEVKVKKSLDLFQEIKAGDLINDRKLQSKLI